MSPRGTRMATVSRRTAGLLVLAALLVAVSAALSACGGDAATAAPQASPSAAAAPAPAEAFGRLLTALDLQASWSYEPRGDLPRDGAHAVVLAHVDAVGPGGAWIRFDAVQGYLGDAAYREASRDGSAAGSLGSPAYYRNRFPHRQRMALAPDCVVVAQHSPSASPANRVHVVAQDQLDESAARGGRYFWVVSDGSQVLGLLQRYSP